MDDPKQLNRFNVWSIKNYKGDLAELYKQIPEYDIATLSQLTNEQFDVRIREQAKGELEQRRQKLHELSNCIARWGVIAAFLLFVAECAPYVENLYTIAKQFFCG